MKKRNGLRTLILSFLGMFNRLAAGSLTLQEVQDPRSLFYVGYPRSDAGSRTAPRYVDLPPGCGRQRINKEGSSGRHGSGGRRRTLRLRPGGRSRTDFRRTGSAAGGQRFRRSRRFLRGGSRDGLAVRSGEGMVSDLPTGRRSGFRAVFSAIGEAGDTGIARCRDDQDILRLDHVTFIWLLDGAFFVSLRRTPGASLEESACHL